MGFNTEKGTKTLMSWFVLIFAVIFALLNIIGEASAIKWMTGIFGLFLAILLFIEAGVMDYIRNKRYKHIGVEDVLVWATLIVGAVTLTNSLLLMSVLVKDVMPDVIKTYLSSSGLITGIVATLLGIYYLIAPKPRA